MRALLFLLLLMSFSAQAAPVKTDKAAPKKIYCWEEKGQTRCGDVLPADAVNQARTERSSRTGNVTREVDRPLTPEEKAEQNALAAQNALQLEQQKQIQRRTDVLLSTYPTENDLSQSFEERRSEVLSAIASMEKAQQPLRQAMITKLGNMGNLELANKAPTPKQVQDFQKARAQYLANRQAVDQLRGDLNRLTQEQNQTLLSYRAAKQAEQL